MAKSLSYYIVIAMIVLFALSTFAVFLYTQPQSDGSTPDYVATPTPLPPFEGVGSSGATVQRLDDTLLVQCTRGTASTADFAGITGVTKPLKVSTNLFMVGINSTAFNTTTGVVDIAYNASACAPRVFRMATVVLSDTVINLTEQAGNNTMPIYKRQIEAAYATRGGPAAYISTERLPNDTVELAILARVTSGAIESFIAQENAQPQQGITFFRANATILALSDQYTAAKAVEFGGRDENYSAAIGALNYSGALTVASWDYQRKDSATAYEGNLSRLDEIKAALQNSSGVLSVADAQDGGIGVTFAANTTPLEARAAMDAAGASNYSLDNSTLRASFTAPDYPAAAKALEIAIGNTTAMRHAAMAALDGREIASTRGVVVPTQFEGEVYTNSTENSTVTISVFALVSEHVATSMSAVEVS